jgi:hypothetical protein
MSGCSSYVTSKRDGDVTLGAFLNIVAPADTGRRFPESIPVVVMPSERCSTFRRLEKLSAAVAALRKLLGPVLVLVRDRGRSCRLIRTAGRLRSFSSPLAPPRDEVTESGDRLRERLKAAINLKAVGEYSGDSGFTGDWGRGDSMLVTECSTNGTSDIVTF